MHRMIRIASLSLSVLACLFMLVGCMDAKHYADVEKQALSYYQAKYQNSDVNIVDSIKAGNAGLFGYLDVKDRAYTLSDGFMVYWDEGNRTFADNAQAKDIQAAFDTQIALPLLEGITFPFKYQKCYLNRTDYDSFDECVFTTHFDGDIRAFLMREKPRITGLGIAIQTSDCTTAQRQVESLYIALKRFVEGWVDVFLIDEGLDALSGDDWHLFDGDLNVIAHARLDFDKDISWYRQAYIQVFDGVYVTYAGRDFVLEDGDMVLEEAGNCEELQRMLDEAYYAMPVDAKENKDGGYRVNDQRHERRVFLDDLEAPIYRLSLSQRVSEMIDADGNLKVYIVDRRESGLPLMVYYGTKSKRPYSVLQVCDIGSSSGEYKSFNTDMLFYFGTHQSVAYSDAE